MTKLIRMDQSRGDDREVYIGRAGKGLDGYFGNPVMVGHMCPVCKRIHEVRGATLPCFRLYAEERLATDPTYRKRVQGLFGKILVCFCAPLPCHGETLIELAAKLQGERL